MTRFNQTALIRDVLASERPDMEAMAIIGSMSGLITAHCGRVATAKMLRVCADLTERFDADRPSSLVEDLCAVLEKEAQK